MTMIMGYYGSVTLQMGPNCSRLIQTNTLFVQSIKVEELDEQKPGLMLYGLYRKPPLDVEISWTEIHDVFVPPNFHKKWVFFLNKGSKVNVSYSIRSVSSSPLSLVIARGAESLVEWLEDPSYPNLTLSWSIIYESGKIQQEIPKSSTYYIAVGNLNSEEVEIQLNFSVNALIYDTTQAYDKCSLVDHVCTLELHPLRENAVVLSSPGHTNEETPNNNWYVKVSYGPRWITYLVGSGVMTIFILLAFRFCKMFQSRVETGFHSGEMASERAPLIPEKDDDISSWGSSYDSASHDEEANLEEWLVKPPLEGNSSNEGESNNPRRLCVVCFDEPRDCFFLPCGHCATCFTCGTRQDIAPIMQYRNSFNSQMFKINCKILNSTCYSTGLQKRLVDHFASQIKTVAGHNLEPTPWHPFPPKDDSEETRQSRAYKIIQCSYLSCPYTSNDDTQPTKDQLEEHRRLLSSQSPENCPRFFKYIYRDLEPWAKSRISIDHIQQAKEKAAFRVVIVNGRLYVDLYYACVQSRLMFTVWGLLQLLKRYPGMVPDVDLMFDCMDKPAINKTEHGSFPLPLFRYCTTEAHFDIPFPDWSFWGWPETNIYPWDEQFRDIKKGSQAQNWANKWPRAFWKGNPDVGAPIRLELMQCNDTNLWHAEIIRQNWLEEAKDGFEQSKLSNQCKHRYKIYAEGYAWSVSLKYILSCGSLALIISPEYEDFFSRGLIPKYNYWPVSTVDLCRSIKFAVDWGNTRSAEAEAIGKRGQQLMESLNMDRVYDYMFHLISEYSKLQDFKPVPPSSAQEVCEESILCLAEPKQMEFLKRATAVRSSTPPCSLTRRPNSNVFDVWNERKQKTIEFLRKMEMQSEDRQMR
ncbi:Lipopolysaccharide-modifying protein [Corchorus capsularis]|uniref:Lipopolysaccharide-modifying protein n=1 Tax=Corchorus capsularis TaxID=210143 RepID=A0A1R3IP00_COCAP|nr:Lipopolysaccharide-modifying protein [Corchorus capsularis]